MEATREISVKLSFDRRQILLALAVFFVAWHPGFIGSETLTLTTYYPAPYGGYVSLLTTGQTLLARDGGGVGIGTGANPVSGSLDVRGATSVSADATTPATAALAPLGVTRVPSGGNLTYVALNRAFSFPWGLGVSGANSFILGQAALSAARDIPTPLFSVSTIGDATVAHDLTVDGAILNFCHREPYRLGEPMEYCPAGTRVVGYSGDGIPQIYGFLPSLGTSGDAGNYIGLGEDWNGTMMCCKITEY